MFLTLLTLTALSVSIAFVSAYRRTRDPFHPLVFLVPMFLALYVFLPLKLWHDDVLSMFFTEADLLFAQLVSLFGVTFLCLGCLHASWKSGRSQVSFAKPLIISKRVLIGAYVLGTVGVMAYLVGIVNVGGLLEAYSAPHGGGWSDLGYIRELVLLCIPAITLILVARTGKMLSGFQWIAIIIFAAPLLTHGLLGARRGPLFLLLAAVCIAWYMVRYRRPYLISIIVAGACLGLFLLFLVSNRDEFYMGSDWKFEAPFSQYLEGGTGNEYIYGAGTILHAVATDDYYWGRRYFITLFIRPIPRQLWPDKYTSSGVSNIEENFGTGGSDFLLTLGWAGASGAAPGLIADMWIEAWWFSMIILYGIGWIYGRAWHAARVKGGFSAVLYVLMASLTLFLVFQTLEAMLFRFLFMAIPAWFVCSLATTRIHNHTYVLKPNL